MISSLRRKHTSMSLNTSEVEYIAARMEIHEALWIQKLLTEIFDLELEPTLIHCDNQSCMNLIENPIFHDTSKHIEVKYHYIWDIVQRGFVKLHYISWDKKITNIFTKPL
jgi:hypothetical protein